MNLRNLKKTDPKMYELVKGEIKRQQNDLVLIPSENHTSKSVLEVMGTPLSDKYSEGYPKKRYYSGNVFFDDIESAAIERAKKIFKAEHANVQPHSGSQANQAVYLALLNPGDRVLGLDLSHGGHLTHGSPVNASGKLYKFYSYGVSKDTEMLDYDEIEKIAKKVKPKLIVCGITAYSRQVNFRRFRQIANKVGAYLLGDVAHISGLIIGGVHPHPFPHCDVVTTTTHKTLRGPSGGLIVCKEKDRLDPDGKVSLAQKIDRAVFPGLQGKPHNHVVAAKAVAFKEAASAGFKKYQKQVVENAKALSEELMRQDIRVVSGGTDNHLMIIDLSELGIKSIDAQNRLEEAGIHSNRNTIPFDKRSPFDPSGIRIGTPAITTRGLKKRECAQVAKLIALVLKNIDDDRVIKQVRKETKALCKKFPLYR